MSLIKYQLETLLARFERYIDLDLCREEIAIEHEGSASESEGESEEESFEEGTYEAKQGDVSFKLDSETEKHSLEQEQSKSSTQQEEYVSGLKAIYLFIIYTYLRAFYLLFRFDIDVELQAACSIVQQHLESGSESPNPKVVSKSALIPHLSFLFGLLLLLAL